MDKVSLKTIMEKCQGLIKIKPKIKVSDSYSLSLVYTPGVGQNCLDIQANPDLLYEYTITANSVALVTDCSSLSIKHTNEVIPCLESECALFKFFYNIDVFPFILDPKLCQTEDDLLLAIENLATIYKVIDLKYISDQRLQALLPKLIAKNLPITVLYSDLWKEIETGGQPGHFSVKDTLNSLIVKGGVQRAILDQRAFIPVGQPLQEVVNYAWVKGKSHLTLLPKEISATFLQVFTAALEFINKAKFTHLTVAQVPIQFYIDRLIQFYIYGKTAFIQPWGENHILQNQSINDNSRRLHQRYSGMISVSPKFKPRSLEEIYNIFVTSFESDDIKKVEKQIREFPEYADKVTFKRNLAAIMTNGTAVLGLGDIGPAAGLPVMEGKSVLFKSLAGIDVVPICIKEKDPKVAIHVFRMLAPIFSAINLEDIKAPECFQIEREMIDALDIPVMHDDQHGTAVICLAAIINGLKLMKKQPGQIKLIINGAGAAGLAICELLLGVGIKNIIICDTIGAIYSGRPKHMNDFKNKLAAITNLDKQQGLLEDVIKGADMFIGVSVAGALKPDMVKSMMKDPFILALANPIPEILPSEAKLAGAFIVATGRSDFKNQVNNSLAFPGIFRGAIETRSRVINLEMKLAAAHAIADLVSITDLNPDYILPGALNADIPCHVARVVAEAAIKSGVARDKEVTADHVQDFTRKIILEGLVPQL